MSSGGILLVEMPQAEKSLDRRFMYSNSYLLTYKPYDLHVNYNIN